MKYQPNRLGTMIDCSRNAVASVESVKKVDRPDVKHWLQHSHVVY